VLLAEEIPASAVAWYAAVVATGSAIVSAYNIFRDRARLQIRVSPNMKVIPPDTRYGDKAYIQVTVTNAGRRPIYVTGVGFEEEKKHGTEKSPQRKFLIAESINKPPTELTEGAFVDLLSLQADFPPSVRFVWVTDSTGRRHSRRLKPHVRLAIEQSNRTNP
jgi:hypothetical protein